MVLVVKCLICQKELNYSQSDPSELVNHMKLEHPTKKNKSKESLPEKTDQQVETSFAAVEKSSQTDANMSSAGSLFHQAQPRQSNDSDEAFGTPPLPESPPKVQHKTSPVDETAKLLGNSSSKSKKYYKTSVESWRPIGDNKVTCPRCQSFCRPTVRTQRTHTTDSSFVSAFFMSCWPMFFSPFYLPKPKFENLNCPVCNYHLGVYDHLQQRVVPSQPSTRP